MSMFSIAPRNMFNRKHGYNNETNSVAKIHNDIDTLFDNALKGFFAPEEFTGFGGIVTPSMDFRAEDKQYVATCELPGVDPDDVSITLQDGMLVIKGEKKCGDGKDEKGYWHSECSYGSFERAFTLPDDADAEHITAGSKHGVLTIGIPRKAPSEVATRRIQIVRND